MSPDVPNPIDVPDGETRSLLGGPMKIELRGYEVAKEGPFGWEQVMKFPPNDKGLARARKEAVWLSGRAAERGDTAVYACRPIVSLDPWSLAKEPPLVLDADEPKEDEMSWDKAKDMVVAMRAAEVVDHEKPLILAADGTPL